MQRQLHRLADRVFLMFTASREDATHYWQMRDDATLAARQPPVPVKTARRLAAMAMGGAHAAVFGSVPTALALMDMGCKVSLIESDPGRAFGAEFHAREGQSDLISVRVIDRGNSLGRQEYAHAYADIPEQPQLIVIAGRNRRAVCRDVISNAPKGSTIVIVRGGREKYQGLRDTLRQSFISFTVDVGPAADGRARRTSALIATL